MRLAGGVRCERASAYLRAKGPAFADVLQLQGAQPALEQRSCGYCERCASARRQAAQHWPHTALAPFGLASLRVCLSVTAVLAASTDSPVLLCWSAHRLHDALLPGPGGIQRYMEAFPGRDSLFRGSLFVFDERISVPSDAGEAQSCATLKLCGAASTPVLLATACVLLLCLCVGRNRASFMCVEDSVCHFSCFPTTETSAPTASAGSRSLPSHAWVENPRSQQQRAWALPAAPTLLLVAHSWRCSVSRSLFLGTAPISLAVQASRA